MNNLTTQQISVINSPAAMELIASEAKIFIANKFNTTVAAVQVALDGDNEKALNMYAELIVTGINAAATVAA